jgi:tetratricopeptide (TPR) repeat protein
MNETAPGPVPAAVSAGTALPPAPDSRSAGRSFRRLVRHPWRLAAVAALLVLIGAGAVLIGVESWALYQFRAARAAAERYHNLEAREHLKACLAVWPHDPATLILAARTARRLGAFDEADHFLDQCSGVRGNEDLALERDLLQAARGDVDPVRPIAQRMVQADHPAAPLLLEAMAAGYLVSYRLREAAYVLDLWRERQPDNTQALLLQALLDADAERYDDAIAQLCRVVELDPDHYEARQRLAGFLLVLGHAADALPHLEYLRRQRPDDLAVQVHLAHCQDLLGHQDEAVKLLDGVLAREPHLPEALAERGKLALRDGQLDQAEAWLREAAEREPSDYEAHYQLHQCLTQNGKPEEARQVQAQLKQIDADLKRLHEIITVDMAQRPHDAALHYEAGMIALRTGAVPDAVRWFDSALREDPHYGPAHQALADYYEKIGESTRAARHRDQVPQAAPQR